MQSRTIARRLVTVKTCSSAHGTFISIRRVEDMVKENTDLRRKCESYETNNRSLVSQLHRLQTLVKQFTPRHVTAQTATCLLVRILCYAFSRSV